MAELATLRWDDDTFWFVSDDGEHFYEVDRPPATDADLEHLRPLGVIDNRTHRISMARRWLHRMGQDPGCAIGFAALE